MSNARRPSSARKVTKKTEDNRKAALDDGVRFRLDEDGDWYVLRPADVTPAVAREIRNTTGRSFMALLTLLVNDPDIDVLSDAAWAACRVRGDDVAYEDVNVTYAQLLSDGFEIYEAGPVRDGEVDDSPEA